MLGKPEHGWVKVTIGKFSDRASYLTDIPIKCLKAFIFAFENNLPATINFDAEGWEYIIIIGHYDIHIISNNSDEGFIYKSFGIEKIDLARELVADIEEFFDDWVDWECHIPLHNSHKEKRTKELTMLLENLKTKFM